MFLCHGLGLGIGSGLTYVPSMSLVSHYFQRHRTLALGIASAGSPTGAIFYPILLNHLLHGPIGFRRGIQITAGLNFALLAIAVTLTKPRLPPTRRESILPKLQKFCRDLPYVAAVISLVFSSCVPLGTYRRNRIQRVLSTVRTLLPNFLLSAVRHQTRH